MMTQPNPSYGGRNAIAGFLYQILRSLRVGLALSVTMMLDGDDIRGMRLTLEPEDGGDHRMLHGDRALVEQIKLRAERRRWSPGSVAKNVFPDLFKASVPGSQQAFRLVTTHSTGLEPLKHFLDARKRLEIGPTIRWGSRRLSVGECEGQLASKADIDPQDPRFSHLLDNFEIELFDDHQAAQDLDVLLVSILAPGESPEKTRFELIGRLLTFAREGRTVSAGALLAMVDSEAILRLALSQSLPEKLRKEAASACVRLGYDPAADARRSSLAISGHLAALPAIPDHEILKSRSPYFGPLTPILWRHRQALNDHCICILERNDVEPSVQKAAIRALALFAEPRLFDLCWDLAKRSDNPVHGFAALAPTLLPNLVDHGRYQGILLEPSCDLQERVAALAVLAAVGADLDELYCGLQRIERDEAMAKFWDFFFLSSAVQSPFVVAIPLLATELRSADPSKAELQHGALTSLGRLPSPAATELLRLALVHSGPSIRKTAALGLASRRDKTALEDLQTQFRAEKDTEIRTLLAAAIVACGARSAADLDHPLPETPSLLLWRSILAARTRDEDFALRLIEMATDNSLNWQLRRAAIHAAGYLPFEAALSTMMSILEEHSRLAFDDHHALATHSTLSWLLLTESAALLPIFKASRPRFVGLVSDILEGAHRDLIGDRGNRPSTIAANWLYDELAARGWPADHSAPDAVINDLHVPLLQSALLRSLRSLGRFDLIETELARTDRLWIATKCVIELHRAHLQDKISRERLVAAVLKSPVGKEPRLQTVLANLGEVQRATTPAGTPRVDDMMQQQHITTTLTYEEAERALLSDDNDPMQALRSPLVLLPLTVEQFEHLSRLADPIHDPRPPLTEHYIPQISLHRHGHSVARRRRTYQGSAETPGSWIRPAIAAANRFNLPLRWHEEILNGPLAKTYAERLFASLAEMSNSEGLYLTLSAAPHLLIPHLCSPAGRRHLRKFADERLLPYLTMMVSTGDDEIFEGLCDLAGTICSSSVDALLSHLFRRWIGHFHGSRRHGVHETSHHLWRAFRHLSEHPRFDRIDGWQAQLSRLLLLPLPAYEIQTITRVLEKDPHSYMQMESLLFKAEDWEHFLEDEIDRLDRAAERLFPIQSIMA